MTTPTIVRTREHLLHMLAEAAELEHNLLCSYLFAAFSLKQSADEDLLDHEWQAVERWRAAIMGVCIEEMVHLAQVANLTLAVGSRPHFDRPNLPAAPGYHPSRIQVALTPFSVDTLDHFIYLERPENSAVRDGAGFTHDGERRGGAAIAGAGSGAGGGGGGQTGWLMPSAPDYATIGEFYAMLESGYVDLSARLGERALFIGAVDYQLRPEEIDAPELSVVADLASAKRAIELIVLQGEGSPGNQAASPASPASHFQQFVDIRDEYLRLAADQPAFTPARPVAANPVMRRPQSNGRVHVTAPAAAMLLDAANATYSLMLRCLVALYETSASNAALLRKALLDAVFGLMRVFGQLARALSAMPATDAADAPNAGVTFAMLRSTEGLAPGVASAQILQQRFADIEQQLPALGLPAADRERMRQQLATLREGLASAPG